MTHLLALGVGAAAAVEITCHQSALRAAWVLPGAGQLHAQKLQHNCVLQYCVRLLLQLLSAHSKLDVAVAAVSAVCPDQLQNPVQSYVQEKAAWDQKHDCNSCI